MQIRENTTFSTARGLYEICKAVDSCDFDASLTELHGFTRRDITREYYQSLKSLRESRRPLPEYGDINFQCFPYPRNIEYAVKRSPEIPYELIIPRKWRLHEQLRVAIHETLEYFTQFFDDDLPKVNVYIDDVKTETEQTMALEILDLIHPITLDFPEMRTLRYENGKYVSRIDAPIALSDLRFIEPERYPELNAYTDTPWYKNAPGWNNGNEIVQQIIFTNIFDKFIPEAYDELRREDELIDAYKKTARVKVHRKVDFPLII